MVLFLLVGSPRLLLRFNRFKFVFLFYPKKDRHVA